MLKKIGCFCLDFVEMYLPAVAFLIMFSVFVLEIFCRYFLNYPLTWAYEVTVFGFIWTVMLGAAFAARAGAHVMFDMIYEKMSPRKQLYMRIVGNTVLAIGLAVTVPASYQYVQFMAFEKSSVLQIPFDLGFAPYIPFLLLVIGHAVYQISVDVRQLKTGGAL